MIRVGYVSRYKVKDRVGFSRLAGRGFKPFQYTGHRAMEAAIRAMWTVQSMLASVPQIVRLQLTDLLLAHVLS